MLVMVVMIVTSMVMGVNMSVFHARSKIFQQLLKKKARKDKQSDQFYSETLLIKLWQDVDHCDRKKIRARKHEQQPVIGILTFRNKIDQQT